ncbi:MAG: UvrD-helicase domain-containing protein [Burkholderiales bacterium]|nr:UvrD-helicase domain-containing protein [Burkholderiales bacterium]
MLESKMQLPTTDAILEARDAKARQRALDVRRSFLVQAPAGSGKTGLLIQRMLALLAAVDAPEAVVAMTFTRKAAGELRERVLAALQQAAAKTPVDPDNAYELTTRQLACAALAQDARRDWQLAANPSRIRVLTIDALVTSFARQTPITTGLGALPRFVDDATAHYREAVTDALADAAADDPDWRRMLLHLDNDAAAATDLLAAMLARRDQWLGLPIGAPDGSLRVQLEATLRRETDAALARLASLIPVTLARALPVHQRYAADNLFERALAPECAECLSTLAAAGGLPRCDADALPQWRALADWLLVKNEPRFRARLDKHVGFPGKDKGEGAHQREAAKKAMADWVAAACAVPGLDAALHAVRTLPPPRHSDDAWAFVAATLSLLPRLAARLQLVFARTGETDFSEATLRALAALGTAAQPGELLLAADLKIHHLLVDEFQDTSRAQLDLIGRLTAGWVADDGRTLFAVGDPMQSIYRFREADVGIFLDARTRGRIGDVAVECLTLARNFRSQRAVLTWVNDVFVQVLTPVANAARGEVTYEPVLATRGDDGDPAPTVDVVADDAAEAAAVVARVQSALDEGAASIAILVRARTHLDAILPALRAANIRYVAVDLESLAERLPTRDLLTLTRALTQPDDRLAALALLRAPWCGLTLADLLAIALGETTLPILAASADPAIVARLSSDGRVRVARAQAALAPVLAARGRMSLASRVRAAWLALGGPACVDGAADLDAAQCYFSLLARHECCGDLADWDAFEAVAAKLFAPIASEATTTVQVMTLHKAKGLEFDTVLLPGLARTPRHEDAAALRWKQRIDAAGEHGLLLAPLHARIGALSPRDPVYAYLTSLDAQEATAELGRLLYVGCTRARRRLHLITAPGIERESDKLPRRWRAPKANCAWAQLWPAIGDGIASPTEAPDGSRAQANIDAAPHFMRLPPDWPVPSPPPSLASPVQAAAAERDPPFDWAQATAAAIGTVTHRLLAQLADEGIAMWTPERVNDERERIAVELAAVDVDAGMLAAAVDRVCDALTRTLADERGQWLFSGAHQQACSEWALAAVEDGVVGHVVVDRSFVADGVRWIVDFKTGQHEGGDVDVFLADEIERYRPQLSRYGRIVRELDTRPIRLALYYPLVAGGWCEWPYPDGGDAAKHSEMR